MKKELLILVALIFAVNLNSQAHDFSVMYNGDSIYYKITSSAFPRSVAVTYRGNYYSAYFYEYTGAVSIPDSVEYNGNYYKVTSIGNYAFYYCTGLTSITIPNSITSIENNAFESCFGLTSITIPDSVTSIGNWAFCNCTGLTSATIPNSITSITYYSFAGCNSLTSITIPNSVTSIGESAFIFCSGLTSITIPNSVTSIGESAFSECTGLTSITIPNSVTSIGESAFSECTGLTSITIPNSITSISNSIFWGCVGLTTVTIPNSVNTIEYGAFSYCSGLTSITIPNSVTSIGSLAFYNCTGLTSITNQAINPPTIQTNSFNGISSIIPVYVPCNSVQSYQSALNWSFFTNYVGFTSLQYINTSICEGSIYTDYGANIDSAGVYTLVSGCDSVILTLSVNPTSEINYYDTICGGVQYSNYGFSFTADTTGIYTQNLQTINGCDSIIKLNLVVNPSYNDTIFGEICEGEAYTQFGFNVDSTGFYTQNMQTTIGCDSVVNLSLIVKPIYNIPHDLNAQVISDYIELTWQGDSSSTYVIYRNDDSLTTTTTPMYLDYDIIPEQTYCYKVKSTNGVCESEFSDTICKTYLGLEDISLSNIQTKLYPNPTNSKSYLEIEGLVSEADVLVYDIVGRVIQKYKINQGTKELEIDLSTYSKGVYSIRIVNESINQTKKLIVQ
ncbi:MAG: leucine-rich repeat protein [Bacteroidales bacterium]|nr:leucine-rich repeat protein [Bacteroidales bacterium]